MVINYGLGTFHTSTLAGSVADGGEGWGGGGNRRVIKPNQLTDSCTKAVRMGLSYTEALGYKGGKRTTNLTTEHTHTTALGWGGVNTRYTQYQLIRWVNPLCFQLGKVFTQKRFRRLRFFLSIYSQVWPSCIYTDSILI
jgi:hypothetical protein